MNKADTEQSDLYPCDQCGLEYNYLLMHSVPVADGPDDFTTEGYCEACYRRGQRLYGLECQSNNETHIKGCEMLQKQWDLLSNIKV